jgi:hypothetical protein
MANRPTKKDSSTGQGNVGDYEVGYKKPPARTRFKKGVSGNPQGKRRGTKSISTILEREFNQRVSIRENGTQVVMTKREAVVKQFVNGLILQNARYARFLAPHLGNLDGATDSAARMSAGIASDDVIDPVDAQKIQELWDQIQAGKESPTDKSGSDNHEDE